MRFYTSLIAFVALLFVASSHAAVGDPDLPGFIPKMENITECSIIIPMDLQYQGDSCGRCISQTQTFNGTSTNDFNMKAYGLVNRLLWNDIPVKWVIKTNKSHEGIDMSAYTWRLFPTNDTHLAPTLRHLSGGPFVIPIYWTEKAIPIIRNYTTTAPHTGGPVQVFKLAETVEVDVRYFITSRPYVAVLDSSKANHILVATLRVSGFVQGQHFKIMDKAEAVALSDQECISMAMEPHFYAGEDSDCNGIGYPNTFVAAMRNFTEGGGNFFAMCGGVSTYENCDNDRGISKDDTCKNSNQNGNSQGTIAQRQGACPDGFFASDVGIKVPRQTIDSFRTTLAGCMKESSMPGGHLPVTNLGADTPFSQWNGKWFFEANSALEAMSLWTRGPSSEGFDGTGSSVYNTSLRAENAAHWVIQDATCTKRKAPDRGIYYGLHAKLAKFHNKRGGNIFYLAGHDYGLPSGDVSDPSCISEGCYNKPGRRMIMNAVLTPANRNCSVPFEISPGVFIQRSLEITLPDGNNFYKKRDILDLSDTNETNVNGTGSSAEGWPCSCTERLDRCAVCGGDGSSCVIVVGPNGSYIPTGLPEGIEPDIVALLTPEVINTSGIIGGKYDGGDAPSNPPIVWPSIPSEQTAPSGQGQVPSGAAAPSQTGPAPGPGPVASHSPAVVNDSVSNSDTTTLKPTEWKHYLVEAGANVADMDIYVTLLSPGDSAVTIYIAKGVTPGGPSATDQCTFTLNSATVNAHDGAVGSIQFKYSADKSSSNCALSDDQLAGSWIVSVASTGSTPASVQVEATLTPIGQAAPLGEEFSAASQIIASFALLLIALCI